MDVSIERIISDTSTTTIKDTTTTTTTTNRIAGRTRNSIKKKRKIYLNKMCEMLRSNNETIGNNALSLRAITCKTSTASTATATTNTSQMSNMTTEHDEVVVQTSTRICLICRQDIKECCQQCCQHLQATKTRVETSTDNNSRFSLINKTRQTVDIHNSNKHNNNNNINNNISNSINYSYRSHNKNLTTTNKSTTTGNCSCMQQNSSCAASSTTIASKKSSSPPLTTELSCLCKVCSCNNRSRRNNNKAATFAFCSCPTLKTTNRTLPATASLSLATTALAVTTSSSSSLSSLSPPATKAAYQQHHSCSNDKNQITTIAAAEKLATKTTTTTTTNATNRSSSFAVSLFRNALRTFQFLILFIQMQLLHPIYNNKLNYSNNNKNYNNNKDKRQQQCPPLPRLKFRRNSYCYNATNINLNNASREQQQASPLPLLSPHHNKQQHTKHHLGQLQHLHSQQHQKQQQQQRQLNRVQIPSQQHFCYCKMPNLSPLYMILIVLSFLSLFLPSTYATQTSLMAPMTMSASSTPTATTSQVRLTRSETVCKSLDIRNKIDNFRQLENCTVIEGFLLMTLVNTHTQGEFTVSYPLLTEVTEFVIVYRIHNLRSLAQIFPNLSVIRGRALHDGYALVVYSNPHLEDLGLSKLTISRGGVRIQDNLLLCFVETIDWTRVVANATDNVIMQNRALMECPKCPGDTRYDDETGGSSNAVDHELSCKEYHGRRHCWSSKACQKICPDRCRDNCVDENTCCNEACVGGCSATNPNECLSCRHYSIYNNTCTDKCPENYYSYLDRRCLTSETCARIGTKYEVDKQETLVPYDGVCTTRCPDGYTKIGAKCQQCDGKCVQYCHGGLIDSVARAKQFHGCTHIGREGLVISIKRGGRHLMEELEFGLSSIEVIDTYLKVHRTIGMFSLEFFKNLKVINGTKLCEEKFALYVLENNDLETLWNPKQNVRINEGRVFFHFNPKLCYSAIDALRPMLKNNATFDKNEVATDSNGYKGSCNTEFLNATVVSSSSVVALVEIVNPLKFEDERTFIGYQYFVIEDEYRNQTKHGHRPCDDGWSASEPVKDYRYLFTGLAPFKQYAFYVKTMTISSEPRNAQSPIQYFKTKSAQPSYVEKLTGYANSSTEIVLNWERPAQAHGNLTKYKVHARLDRRNDNIQVGSRNYCKDPLKEAAKTDVNIIKTPSTEKPEIPNDCKCRKESNYDDDAEASIHGNIEFENSIQNFVYVKDSKEPRNESKSNEVAEPSGDSSDSNNKRFRRSRETEGDSFLIRHMRALPDETMDAYGDLASTTTSTSTTTMPPSTDESSYVLGNETRMDPNGEYYELFFDSVNASTKSFVFTGLKHFSTYMLGVEACREPEVGSAKKECSRVQTMFVRTMGLENVDKVENLQAKLEQTNSSRYNIRLRWDPPERPNGAVVSYTIIYLNMAQDAVPEKKCITALDYRNMTNGYILTGLPTGNYSIKVRANTLAGEGIFSKLVYIDIPPTKISSTIIALIVISIIILISLIAGVFFYMRKKLLVPPSDLKIFPTVNPFYISLQYIPDDWEVPRERVLQLSPLGQGSFGMVYEGILKAYNSSADDTPCAIKTVNENATDRERMNFLNEASVMKQFDTYHVVRLLGVCSRGQPALVIMELMKNGDLKSYLRAHRPDECEDALGNLSIMTPAIGIGGGGLSQPPTLSRIYQMALEIADGMAYLSAKKFVHRDLAARNCMVASDLTVKIGDFGMTRDIYETDYYRKGTKGLLPVRWMPPESLRDGVYSSASDVFSYGVVLWEMSTLASQPYQGLSNDQVLRYVIDGGVMERPENCPDKLYRLMQMCWHHRPSARPSFMTIITSLLDMADPNFRDVAYYHSEDGQIIRNKELKEQTRHSGDIFGDNDNDMDDVTTPLRVGEYNNYQLNMDNNSSVENHESPTIIDYEHPNSPFSGSVVINSTPDNQLRYGYNINETTHQVHTPSTSAGAAGGAQLPAPPSHHRPHLPYRLRYQNRRAEEEAAYVQPDYDIDDAPTTTTATASGAKSLTTATASGVGKSVETDERGYELYDPSPNYREHAPYAAADDDDDDEGDDEEENFASSSRPRLRAGTAGSGGKNLLPRLKGGSRATPTIMPMSQSMPDEATSISAPTISSSLHPSTASAASSNASSTTTTAGGGGIGKLPSLKRAVADTVQSMPARLRNINRRIFSNHKRSGSTASHGSTSSNPNAASSSSNTNLTGSSARGKSVSGQNLGTIESGGSGSAGSCVAAPRFFTPVGGEGASSSVSENPNYKLLDETANTSIVSATVESPTSVKTTKVKTPSAASGFTTSTNPNYRLLNESAASVATPKRAPAPTHTSENPNYEIMQAPPAATMQSSENPNYVMMTQEPETAPVLPLSRPAEISENPNYQMMGAPPTNAQPSSSGNLQPFSTLSAALRREKSRERFQNSTTPSSSSVDDDDQDDDEHTENIKMERMPLSRPKSSSSGGSRSRSQSQTRGGGGGADESKTSTPTSTGGAPSTTSQSQEPKSKSVFSLKEKWLRQQQQQQQQLAQQMPKPPPNGFIGRET